MKKLLFVSLSLLSASLFAAPDLEGVWVLNGPGTESEILLTSEGKRIQAEYDLLVDDPSLHCIPASASRVWANPNSRVKIEQLEDRILIAYELFDLRREILIGSESDMPDSPSTRNVSGTYFPEMGSSFAYYDGGRLIIESRNHSVGFIRTSRGIPQSEYTVTREEITRVDDTLRIVHTYTDEAIFEEPLVLEYFLVLVDEQDILPYECTDSDYDWFLQLNNPDQREP